MTAAAYVFWICLFLAAYTYLLYPLVLFLAYAAAQFARDWKFLTQRDNRRVLPVDPARLPAVSFVIPAYNEERCLAQKLANLQEMDYPQERLQVIFVSDGSTDGTNRILASVQEPNIEAILLPHRGGKPTALNRGVEHAKNKILIFSDASTLFAADAIRNLIRHFADPRVGAVCGGVQLKGSAESEQTEGLYWKWESMLRLMEARLGATVNASGAIYALRRTCYEPLAADDVVDDLLIPMNARKLGYQIVDDPEAMCTEFSASDVKGEFIRRVRLAVGSFRALRKVSRIPLRGFTGLAFVSHKLLRWVLPFLLIGLLVSNGLMSTRPLYRTFFAAQLAFYLWACLGYLFRNRLQRVRFALFGYFLLTVHLAFLVGFWRCLFGRESSTWQRVN